VVGGVDAQELLADATERVAGHVEREEAARADTPLPPEPDERSGEREVPAQLVEKGRVEGGERFVAGRAVGR